MASFKIEDLEQSVHGHVLNTRELTPKKAEEVIRVVGRRGKRSLAESEMLIKNYILGSSEPVTMLQILDHIQRANAPHFRKIIDNLVATGQVAKAADNSVGGNLPRFWYWRP
jgi:hypothetical protein